MTDERRPYRRPSSLDQRVTVVEVEQRNLNRRFDEHMTASDRLHRDQSELVTKLDQRADRQDVLMARLLAGLAIAGFLGQLLAPIILKALGLGS